MVDGVFVYKDNPEDFEKATQSNKVSGHRQIEKKSPFVLSNDEKVGIYNSIKYMKYLGKYLTAYVQDLYIEICTLNFSTLYWKLYNAERHLERLK